MVQLGLAESSHLGFGCCWTLLQPVCDRVLPIRTSRAGRVDAFIENVVVVVVVGQILKHCMWHFKLFKVGILRYITVIAGRHTGMQARRQVYIVFIYNVFTA